MEFEVTFHEDDNGCYELSVTLGTTKLRFGEPYLLSHKRLDNMIQQLHVIQSGGAIDHTKQTTLSGGGNSGWYIRLNESNMIVVETDISGSGEDFSMTVQLPNTEMKEVFELIRDINLSIKENRQFTTDDPRVYIIREAD